MFVFVFVLVLAGRLYAVDDELALCDEVVDGFLYTVWLREPEDARPVLFPMLAPPFIVPPEDARLIELE